MPASWSSVVDTYCGIDLDHCRDPETGAIEPWAQTIIDRLRSYTEITPSGTGIRIWIKGQWIVGHNRKGNIEIYDQGRYFTVTGQHLAGTPLTIEYRATELMALRDQLWPTIPGPINPLGPPRPTSGLSVYEILELARQHKNADKWDRLMRGDISDYKSPSEADEALCCLAAFYTREPGVIDQIVRLSGLSRDKWERQDYRERTVGRALELVTESYTIGDTVSNPSQDVIRVPRITSVTMVTRVTGWDANALLQAEFPEAAPRFTPDMVRP